MSGASRRGNGNSYLTVTLPPRQRRALFAVAMAIGEQTAALSGRHGSKAVSFEKPPSFDVMAFDGLHMTFCFGGKKIGLLPGEKLVEFHAHTGLCVEGSPGENAGHAPPAQPLSLIHI